MKIALLVLLFSSLAWGKDTDVSSVGLDMINKYKHIIYQKEKKFSQKTLTVRVNEPVVFVNSDPIVHNVFSQAGKHSFNLKAQTPNSASIVKFKYPGKAEIFCAIHPRMKLIVTIIK